MKFNPKNKTSNVVLSISAFVIVSLILWNTNSFFKKFKEEERQKMMKALTAEEIEHYVDHYKPMDKAGAYGIQEWIGMIGIEKIVGDYYNVMGLPCQQLYGQLTENFS